MDIEHMETLEPDHEQKIEQAQHRAEHANKAKFYFGHFPSQTREQQEYHQKEFVIEP